MEVELRPERPQNVDVTQPVDVDPGDALVVQTRYQLVFVCDGVFFEMRFVILD
jgi:hypothetical protein